MANRNITVEVKFRKYFLGLDYILVIGLIAGHFFSTLVCVKDLDD